MKQALTTSQSSNHILVGIVLLVASCIAAFVAFILGMMMLSVMGGVNAGPNIPNWYNLAMWLGWPAMLGVTAITPSVALWTTNSWKWPVWLLIGGGSISFAWFAVGLVLMVSYGMQA
ncbi:MAG: hypothetical protein AAF497_13685 [Planctomycetota bacterium]